MFTLLAAIITSLVGVAVAFGTSQLQNNAIEETNNANLQATSETNDANLQAVRETNAANLEQANLAYSRSLPVNQVRDLMDAGMSKAGALTKLAGGGVYSPPALQASTAESARFMPKQFDASLLSQIIDRLGNIPSNVQQSELVETQINNAKEELLIKQQAAVRELEQHRFNMWKQKYDKNQALLLDSASSTLANALLDSGKSVEDFKDFNDMIRKLNLQNDEDIRNLTHLARTDLETATNSKFAEYRSQRESSLRERAAQDVHDLANFEKKLKQTDLSERDQSLVYKLAILANNVESSNFQVDLANYEKELRDAGFANKKEASAAIAAAENLESMIRKDKSQFIATRNSHAMHLGYAIEWLVDKISPFKGLLNGK